PPPALGDASPVPPRLSVLPQLIALVTPAPAGLGHSRPRPSAQERSDRLPCARSLPLRGHELRPPCAPANRVECQRLRTPRQKSRPCTQAPSSCLADALLH